MFVAAAMVVGQLVDLAPSALAAGSGAPISALSQVPFASPTTPHVLDAHPGSFGALAPDGAGNLYLAWLRTGKPDADMFCKIAEAASCLHPVTLAQPSGSYGTDQPFPVLGPDGAIYVVAGSYVQNDVLVWTSADGGNTLPTTTAAR